MNRKMREAYRKVGISYPEPELVEAVKPEAERRGVERPKLDRGKHVTMTYGVLVKRIPQRNTAWLLRLGWKFCPKSAWKVQRGA